MKRAGNLFERVTQFENLHQAAYRVLKGKRGQPEACTYVTHLEANLIRLQTQLLDGTWQPGVYRNFYIHEPKLRLISAASIADRVVHHALVAVIEPIFERRFIHHSYACRRGRGTHRARARFYGMAKRYRFTLKMDIQKFFPSLDHEVLLGLLRQKLKDERVVNLCRLIIDRAPQQSKPPYYFEGDDLLSPAQRRFGIPIGNLTSQFFGNVYLDPIDHFMQTQLKAKGYLRYVDDFCCFANTKEELRAIRERVVESLGSLRLKLNHGKSRIMRLKEGIEFLGFVHFPSHVRLSPRNVRRQRKRLKQLKRGYGAGLLKWADVRASLDAWNEHVGSANTWHLRESIFRQCAFQSL